MITGIIFVSLAYISLATTLIVCCLLISAPLALVVTFSALHSAEAVRVLCLQTIGVSLLLPVVKGKPSQLALFLPAEL